MLPAACRRLPASCPQLPAACRCLKAACRDRVAAAADQLPRGVATFVKVCLEKHAQGEVPLRAARRAAVCAVWAFGNQAIFKKYSLCGRVVREPLRMRKVRGSIPGVARAGSSPDSAHSSNTTLYSCSDGMVYLDLLLLLITICWVRTLDRVHNPH